MSATLRQSQPSSDARIALGASHGYRFDGDSAILNAELAIQVPPAFDVDGSRDWALQLWACDAPFERGSIDGFKVAEARLAFPRGDEGTYVETRSFAKLPPGQRDYAMVMVLASGEHGVFERVDDFANYAARQRFVIPYLEGSVGYRIEGDHLSLQAERVLNPRLAGNLSGTLALELWALTEPYAGGAISGSRLGQVELAPLPGQAAHASISACVPVLLPPPGTWQLTLMLREWTGPEGYITRDYRNFAAPHVVEAAPAPRMSEPPVSLSIVPSVTAVPSARNSESSAPPAGVRRPASGGTDAPKLVALPAPVADTTAASSMRVSAQHAPLDELAHVPGLNRKLAAAIVRARPLRSLDDLKRVRGIGDKLLRSLRPHLTV